MKRIPVFLLTVVLLMPSFVYGEIKTITHSVKQVFGGSQSPDDARTAGLARSKREALEMAGTYIKSTTVVSNARVEQDEILAIAAGILKSEIVSEKNYLTGEAFGIEITVKVDVDMSVLESSVQHMLKERSYLEQLKKANDREKALLQKVAMLEEENKRIQSAHKDSPELKKEFRQTTQGLKAVEAVSNLQRALFLRDLALQNFNRYRALYDQGLVTRSDYESHKAYYTMAIEDVKKAEAAMQRTMAF